MMNSVVVVLIVMMNIFIVITIIIMTLLVAFKKVLQNAHCANKLTHIQ